MEQQADCISRFQFEFGTCELYKGLSEEYPYTAVLTESDKTISRIDYRTKPSQYMIEDDYLTIMADEMIEKREKEIADTIQANPQIEKEADRLAAMGFDKERRLFSLAAMNVKVGFDGISHEGKVERSEKEVQNFDIEDIER